MEIIFNLEDHRGPFKNYEGTKTKLTIDLHLMPPRKDGEIKTKVKNKMRSRVSKYFVIIIRESKEYI